MEVKQTRGVLERGTGIILFPIKEEIVIHSWLTQCLADVEDAVKIRIGVEGETLNEVMGSARILFNAGCRVVSLVPSTNVTNVIVLG